MNQQTTYNIELNANDLFTLEQMCKAIRECGSSDWGESEFRMIVNITPTSPEVNAALERFVRHQPALGMGGLPLMVLPRIR